MEEPTSGIIKVRVKDLVPYAKNPRRNDSAVPILKDSLKKFSYVDRIVVAEDMTIVSGHTRVKAMMELGWQDREIEVIQYLAPADVVKAYRIAANSTGQVAEWDYDLLDEELADLPDFDFDDFGMESTTDAESILDKFTATEALDRGSTNPTTLQMTLLFPIEASEPIKAYLKDHSKDDLVDACLHRMGIST